MNNSRKRVYAKPANGESKTEQHHAPAADINAIVNRHKPGQFIGDPRATRQPMFIDCPSESYHESLNRITQVKLAFSSLPARIRGMFSNDPFHLLAFIEKPENRPRALRLGLVVPTDEEAHELASLAAKARRTEQVDLIREAMKETPQAAPRADNEAQPPYRGRQSPQGD